MLDVSPKEPLPGRLTLFAGSGDDENAVRRMLAAALRYHQAGARVVVRAPEQLSADLRELAMPMAHASGRVALSGVPTSNSEAAPPLVVVPHLAGVADPASGCSHRWEEVQQLLSSGVDVFSSVAISELESLHEAMARLLDHPPAERVPDALFDRARMVVVDDVAEPLKGSSGVADHDSLRITLFRRVAQALERRVPSEWALSGAEHARAGPECVLALIEDTADIDALVRAAKRIADTFNASLQALHVETPRSSQTRSSPAVAGALKLAVELGATIATVPAATIIDGLEAHLASSPATHIVLGERDRSNRRLRLRQSLVDRLKRTYPHLVAHIFPTAPNGSGAERTGISVSAGPGGQRRYLTAEAFVVATLVIALALDRITGARPLDLLFLVPVIAVAARSGIGPALLAVALSVGCYNFFLLAPAYRFSFLVPQNGIMLGVLTAAGVYTSLITTQLRSRLVLSDRSARENANVAAFAQRLTRVSDWESTALAVCEQVSALLKVQSAVFREVGGTLSLAAAVPTSPVLSPVDQAALDWAWLQGEQSGSGTAQAAAADWQFHPLTTSLGTLAVLGLAREDGRDPIPPEKSTLLSTLIAQAALAHERLRLEDVLHSTVQVQPLGESE